MSESNVTFSSHSLGILMARSGRFVSCVHCNISVPFPAGARYDIIAKQFESYSCGLVRPPNKAASVEEESLG